MCLFWGQTSQHGAPWCVATAPLITAAPAVDTPYDEAEPAASETSRWPRLSRSKPTGVPPADGETTGVPAMPFSSTGYTSIVFDAFSVTTSTLPSGENCTCAGTALPAPSGRVEPASG